MRPFYAEIAWYAEPTDGSEEGGGKENAICVKARRACCCNHARLPWVASTRLRVTHCLGMRQDVRAGRVLQGGPTCCGLYISVHGLTNIRLRRARARFTLFLPCVRDLRAAGCVSRRVPPYAKQCPCHGMSTVWPST